MLLRSWDCCTGSIDVYRANERARLVGAAAEKTYGADAETPANKRRRLREAGKPIKKVQFRDGAELERVSSEACSVVLSVLKVRKQSLLLRDAWSWECRSCGALQSSTCKACV